MNLLEKQLSTVYFKDVRFPWVTLYNITTYHNYFTNSHAVWKERLVVWTFRFLHQLRCCQLYKKASAPCSQSVIFILITGSSSKWNFKTNNLSERHCNSLCELPTSRTEQLQFQTSPQLQQRPQSYKQCKQNSY